ncbi:hypothetical protein BaRGS_00014195, partial [Batillaria attramentaria]
QNRPLTGLRVSRRNPGPPRAASGEFTLCTAPRLAAIRTLCNSVIMSKKTCDQLWEKLQKEGKDSKSLLKKHLTEDLYKELKDKKTKFGGTLADCIRSGAGLIRIVLLSVGVAGPSASPTIPNQATT